MARNLRHTQPRITHLLVVCLALVWGVAVGLGVAAEAPQQTFGFPKREEVEKRLTKALEDRNLSADERERLESLYRATLHELTTYQDTKSRLKELDQRLADAPRLREEMRKALTSPPIAVVVDYNATLEVIEQRAVRAEADLAATQNRVQALKQALTDRDAQRTKLSEQITKYEAESEESIRNLQALANRSTDAEKADYNRLRSRLVALRAMSELAHSELGAYQVMRDLVSLEAELEGKNLTERQQALQVWQDAVSTKRRIEAERAAATAERMRRAAVNAHPSLHPFAEENAQLTVERTGPAGLNAMIDRAEYEVERTNFLFERISKEYEGVRRRLDAAGLTSSLGILLINRLANLPDEDALRYQMNQRQRSMADVQLRLIELEDLRIRRANLTQLRGEVQRELEATVPAERLPEHLEAMQELLRTNRDTIEILVRDYNAYLVDLADLDTRQRQLLANITEFRQFIREHILWVRSTSTLDYSDAEKLPLALWWLVNPDDWAAGLSAIALSYVRDVRASLLTAFLGVLCLLGLSLRRRIIARLDKLNDLAVSHEETPLETLHILGLTLVLAGIWPAAVLVLAQLVGLSYEIPPNIRGVVEGLRAVALAFFFFEFIRQLLRPGGFFYAHYSAAGNSFILIRKHLTWLVPVMLACVFLVRTLEFNDNQGYRETSGRLFLLLGAVFWGWFVITLLHKKSVFWRELEASKTGKPFARHRYTLQVLALSFPVSLCVVAGLGYFYTAKELTWRITISLWCVFLTFLVQSLTYRWLGIGKTLETPPVPGARKDDPEEMRRQQALELRKLTLTLTVGVCILALYSVWESLIPALGILNRVEVSSYTTVLMQEVAGADGVAAAQAVETRVPVTLGDVLTALLIVMFTIWGAKNLPGLLDFMLFRRLSLDTGAIYATRSVTRYIVALIGIVLTLSRLGFAWDNVQWLVAAVSVGLGFGLQEIFANFVSGLIILFERPIRIGDTVTIGDVTGTVTRIQMRATTIQDWTRKELIVPNKEFITSKVMNWTLDDRMVRIDFNVGVAYGTDPQLVMDLLLQVATDNPKVLTYPKPRVVFERFGDSSLDFSLRVFLPDIEHSLPVRNEINMAIDREFRGAGIVIPFPQRDLNLDPELQKLLTQYVRAQHPHGPHQEPPPIEEEQEPLEIDPDFPA